MSGAPSKSRHFNYIFVIIDLTIGINFNFSNSFILELYFRLVFATSVYLLSILAGLIFDVSRFLRISCLFFLLLSKAHSFHIVLFLFRLLLRFLLSFPFRVNSHMLESIEVNEAMKCFKAMFPNFLKVSNLECTKLLHRFPRNH